MSEGLRTIDPQAIQAAEYHRKNSQLELATVVTATALGRGAEHPITGKEVNQLALVGGESLLDLARIARIDVDTLKSLANQAKSPLNTYQYLHDALSTIKTVYINSAIKRALAPITDPEYLLGEMNRDRAKILQSASFLYSSKRAARLLEDASKLLERTFEALPEDHSLTPLVEIERQLLRARMHQITNPHLVARSFTALKESDLTQNPHRVASIASMILNNSHSLRLSGLTEEQIYATYIGIINEHPEWGFMMASEAKKNRLLIWKQRIFPKIADLLINEPKLKELHYQLHSTSDH